MNPDGTACAVGKLFSEGSSYEVKLCVGELFGKIVPVFSETHTSTCNGEVISDNYSYRLADMPNAPIEYDSEILFPKPFYIETHKK